MYETISYCGLDCSVCPAFKATQSGDMEELTKVAEGWSKEYGRDIPVETVICDGCKQDDGRLCGYCSVCQARSCARGKNVITCAHCADYVCSNLEDLPAFHTECKAVLDKIKEGL